MPKSKSPGKSRAYYTLAVEDDGKSAELTMYGQIVESRPVDWWTGEPVEGQFIVLQDFLNDLETISSCENITIHINSVGGDAYSSIAIHNRLRELSNAGANITCIVDGVAMSGGGLIMCAANTVKVNPSSIVMIHDCWSFVCDSMNSSAFHKMAGELDVIDNSQAEIYARKTGKTKEECRKMMDETTYFSGREAVDNGFADELLDDEADPDISVSADHRTLYACGRSMRIAALGQLPEGIKTVETAPKSGVDKSPEASGKEGGCKPMTLEEFRKENPEAAAALLAEAQASVNTDEAVQNERQRLAEIDAVANLFDAETVNAAKYTKPCSAQEMCYRAAQASVAQGKAFLRNLAEDSQDSGAGDVGAAPSPEEDKPMSNADMLAAGRAAAMKARGKTE